jgi:tetratricopeptide (TPR) repeat protein
MPCLGGTTLEQLLRGVRAVPPEKRTGRHLLEALEARVANPRMFWPARGPNRRFLERASYVQAVCWVGVCLADALHYAHEQGLVHLDVKPSNVLLTADCEPMLLDFHLACGPVRPGADVPAWLGGTDGYMSPEQEAALRACREQRPVPAAVEARSDVFSLGLLLREALYGELPEGDAARAAEHLPSRRDVAAGLRDVLARCLCPDPAARYPSAALVAEDLRRHLTDRPLLGVRNRLAERWRKWRRRRPQALLVSLLVAACLAAAAALVASGAAQTSRHRRDVAAAPQRQGAGARTDEAASPAASEQYTLGCSLLEAGDLDGASAAFDRAVEDRPQEFWSWFGKGTCAHRRGRDGEAVAAFSVCVALAPDSAACYYNRGLALAAGGNADAALRDYDRALRLDPRLAGAALNRGALLFQRGRYAEAEADFARALELGANPAAVYYNRALLHQARQEPAAALACVERALELDPGHRPRATCTRSCENSSSPSRSGEPARCGPVS